MPTADGMLLTHRAPEAPRCKIRPAPPCPAPQQCFPFEFIGIETLDDGMLPEYDYAGPDGFCDCNTWNWFTGPECDEMSGHSMVVAAIYWLLAIMVS